MPDLDETSTYSILTTMTDIPLPIREKVIEREKLRKQGDFPSSDGIRNELLQQGYEIKDKPDGTTEVFPVQKKTKTEPQGTGTMVVFGSGELSTTGRKIHEDIIKTMVAPVKIALLETPAGYEDNPDHWYIKLKKSMEDGLVNFKPVITLVPAYRNDGEKSTNNDSLLSPLLTADYIHTGAGSPSYAVKHLKNSLALRLVKERLLEGAPVSIASAAAVAFGTYTIPVYEIYFAGHEPSWTEGLDFFGSFGLNITFVPHWNNKEGGKDIDTRFCYMGEKRWKTLLSILPGPTTIVGIDEHTALVFNFSEKTITVAGKGSATIVKGNKTTVIKTGSMFSFEDVNYLYTPCR